jgi:hypothetical protein
MGKIEKVSIENETIYLKKGILGWNVINPLKNEDGTTNWKNLLIGGSWIKLILIILFVIFCVGAIFEVSHIVKIANECLSLNRFPLVPMALK